MLWTAGWNSRHALQKKCALSASPTVCDGKYVHRSWSHRSICRFGKKVTSSVVGLPPHICHDHLHEHGQTFGRKRTFGSSASLCRSGGEGLLHQEPSST